MRTGNQEMAAQRIPEARYAYYRRCQVFRKGGEQCKAPAEKGSHICYAHAGQLAMAMRRERERQAVLAEAVARMRKRGRPECEAADLFMDLKGINVTIAVMAQALIAGRIDCKTAGRLLVQLQTVSKLLRIYHRGHRETQRTSTALTTKDTRSTSLSQAHGRSGQATKHEGLPQIFANERRLEKQNPTAEAQRRGELPENLPLISTDNTDLRKTAEGTNLTTESWRHEEEPSFTAEARRRREDRNTERDRAANERERMRIALMTGVMAIANRRGWAHAPPELLIAA